MWEGCTGKGQESAHILPQKEERRWEESRVLGVGGQCYKKKIKTENALFSNIFMRIKACI